MRPHCYPILVQVLIIGTGNGILQPRARGSHVEPVLLSPTRPPYSIREDGIYLITMPMICQEDNGAVPQCDSADGRRTTLALCLVSKLESHTMHQDNVLVHTTKTWLRDAKLPERPPIKQA